MLLTSLASSSSTSSEESSAERSPLEGGPAFACWSPTWAALQSTTTTTTTTPTKKTQKTTMTMVQLAHYPPRHLSMISAQSNKTKSTTWTKLQLLIAGQCHLPGHFDENVLFLCKPWKINNNNNSRNNRLDTNINVLFLGILQAFYLLPVKISTSSRYCLPPLEKCNVLNVKSKQIFVKEF